MKILVTGGRGQLGQELVRAALGAPNLRLWAVGREVADLENIASVEAAVSRAAPDVIINCAAYTAVDRAEEESHRAASVNVDGAAALARTARLQSCELIAISTDYVFDGPPGVALTENSPVNPVNVYGQTKLEGERAVLAEHPPAMVVRTAWLHSACGRNFVKRLLALDDGQVEIVDDQWGSPTDAAALARALLAMLEVRRTLPSRGRGEVYHLANGGSASWARLAEHVFATARTLGRRPTTVRRTRGADRGGARRPEWSVLDSSKFAGHFGIALPPWQDGASATVAAIAAAREQGWTRRSASG